jgi:hypothetical protein
MYIVAFHISWCHQQSGDQMFFVQNRPIASKNAQIATQSILSKFILNFFLSKNKPKFLLKLPEQGCQMVYFQTKNSNVGKL